MRTKIVLLVCAALFAAVLVAGCGANVPKLKDTASGRPEALFVGESVATVKNKIIADMVNTQFMLTDSGDSYLLFARPIEGQQRALLMMVNTPDTSGAFSLRYILAPKGKDTFVTVHMHMELIKPLGKEVYSSTSNENINDIQKRLFDLGGK